MSLHTTEHWVKYSLQAAQNTLPYLKLNQVVKMLSLCLILAVLAHSGMSILKLFNKNSRHVAWSFFQVYAQVHVI